MPLSTTTVLSTTQERPSSSSTKATICDPEIRSWPRSSTTTERGRCKPVATSRAAYPDATPSESYLSVVAHSESAFCAVATTAATTTTTTAAQASERRGAPWGRMLVVVVISDGVGDGDDVEATKRMASS